ncbi:MAG: hypothetical protein ACRDXC_05075 [Acidimicrobiales bacterium]
MKTYTLSIPPRDAYAVVPSAIAALDGEIAALDVMAGSLTFATPLDLCALRGLLDLAANACESVSFDCPVTPDVHNYLGRMNFYDGLASRVRLSAVPPQLNRRDRRARLIEVCRIVSADDVQVLEESVWEVARAHFGTGSMAKACVSVIAAATENVLDHADSPVGAVVAAQSYRNTGLKLAVVDLGRGIPTTLRTRREYCHLSDVEAVERALDDGVTSTGQAGRGAGLAEIIDSARRTKNSTLVIQSGRAQFTVSCSAGACNTYASRPGVPTPGTWISLVLNP